MNVLASEFSLAILRPMKLAKRIICSLLRNISCRRIYFNLDCEALSSLLIHCFIHIYLACKEFQYDLLYSYYFVFKFSYLIVRLTTSDVITNQQNYLLYMTHIHTHMYIYETERLYMYKRKKEKEKERGESGSF